MLHKESWDRFVGPQLMAHLDFKIILGMRGTKKQGKSK